jgi:protein-disulfide isomerase
MASPDDDKARAREARLAAEQDAARTAKRRTALLRLGLVLGLAVVVVVIAVVVSSGGGDTSTPRAGNTSSPGATTAAGSSDAKDVDALFAGIPQNGVTLGDPKAPATLMEFADLQCPYCAELSNAAMTTIVDRYVKTGKVRYELRLRSFLGPDSVRAAGAAAAAASEDKLFQFADLFYRRQGTENSGYVTDAFLTSIAKDVGVKPGAALAAAKNGQNEPLVGEAERKAQEIGSQATPEFYVRLAGGRLVKVQLKALTAAAFTEALDAALSQT